MQRKQVNDFWQKRGQNSHVNRMVDNETVKREKDKLPEGTKSLGRLCKEWNDNFR